MVRARKAAVWGAAAVAIVIAAAGCAPRLADPGLFAEAEYLILEQRFEEAIPLLRRFLVSYPDHAGAHYYLGRCYFAARDQFWLAIAQGELETALNQFHASGGASPIERFDDTYFGLICHLDIAKIQLKRALFLLESGAPRELCRALLADAREMVERARGIDPESPDVETIEGMVEELARVLGEAGPAEETAPAPPRRVI